MNIIHTADLHLGSKIEAKLKKISNDRKAEVRNSFMRLADYAEENGVKIILLSGDVFDSDKPSKKDKDTFYSVIENHPSVDFLYLRGNHDTNESNNKVLPNLKTFNKEWTSYEYGNVVITGLELDSSNSTSFYSTLNLDSNKVNIVMLHGQVSESVGLEKIKISKLRNKNIDYLALGHIHKHSGGNIDTRGSYFYSGCLEGRGFDEIGEKGFILLNVTVDKVYSKFVPFSVRTIHDDEVDISDATSIPEIIRTIKDTVKINPKDIYRFILVGDVSFELEFNESDIESYFSDNTYFVNVKNKTLPLIDPDKFKNDLSIKGEFVRQVYANDELTDESKRKIASLGLKALEGRDLEL